MAALNFKPMGIGEILDTTFRLYREKFLTFLAISLTVYLPVSVVVALIEVWGKNAEAGAPTPEVNLPLMIAGGAGYFLFALLVFPLCTAAIVQTISGAYLGEEINSTSAYKLALPRLFPLLIANLLTTVLVTVGYIMCLVPGVIFTFWFWLVPTIVILEGIGPVASMKRSKSLMKGNVNKAFGLGLVIGILMVLLSLGIAFLIGLLPISNAFIPSFLNSLSQALILPFSAGSIVLLYYDLRIRKEAFDLEQLAADFGRQ